MSEHGLPGLYVHVPFCRTKCPYCDFYSVTSPALIQAWLQGLRQEVSLYKEKFPAFDSLYLGGGTPTLLHERELRGLLVCLRRNFSFAEDTEITIEANPDDISAGLIDLLCELGVNRISVGAQSMNEGDLRFLSRRHSALQTGRALGLIRSSQLKNLGVDLIYGIPGQSLDSWIRTMEGILEFKPEHLSCYQMTLEDGTPFGKMKTEGRIKPLGEELEKDFFLSTSRFLEKHGYIHYEISNFARTVAHTSRHNRKYWRHVPYLGLGPGAHSFQNGRRWWNTRSIEEYCQSLSVGKTPIEGTESLSKEQIQLESLYLGLRTKEGVARQTVLAESGNNGPILARLKKSGLVRLQDERIIPTRKGFLVADSLPLLLCR